MKVAIVVPLTENNANALGACSVSIELKGAGEVGMSQNGEGNEAKLKSAKRGIHLICPIENNEFFGTEKKGCGYYSKV